MPLARTLFTEDKKLRVFDFDDTLVKTTSFIYVKHKDGKESKLSPGQYAVYKERPGDDFDYRDFQKVSNPKLIKGYVELLKRMVNSGGSRDVFILTARAAEKPVSQFIKDLGIRGVTVIALGDANPEKKADWIEDKVKAGFDDVYFVDDSPKNVEAVRNRLSRYPNVKKKIQQVKQSELHESVLRENAEPVYYFAYGSNMDIPLFKSKYKSAKPLELVYLTNYKLIFDKYSVNDKSSVADVTKSLGNRVFGLLYTIDKSEIPYLDNQENGYDKEWDTVTDGNGKEYKVFFYSVIDKAKIKSVPTKEYIGKMVVGIKDALKLGPAQHGKLKSELIKYLSLIVKLYKNAL
jgi:FMN phosphatase YigB (HAD superfamily)/cation transport regulator ChaC